LSAINSLPAITISSGEIIILLQVIIFFIVTPEVDYDIIDKVNSIINAPSNIPNQILFLDPEYKSHARESDLLLLFKNYNKILYFLDISKALLNIIRFVPT